MLHPADALHRWHKLLRLPGGGQQSGQNKWVLQTPTSDTTRVRKVKENIKEKKILCSQVHYSTSANQSRKAAASMTMEPSQHGAFRDWAPAIRPALEQSRSQFDQVVFFLQRQLFICGTSQQLHPLWRRSASPQGLHLTNTKNAKPLLTNFDSHKVFRVLSTLYRNFIWPHEIVFFFCSDSRLQEEQLQLLCLLQWNRWDSIAALKLPSTLRTEHMLLHKAPACLF